MVDLDFQKFYKSKQKYKKNFKNLDHNLIYNFKTKNTLKI